MRLALHNHDDLVVLGLTTMLARHAPDIEVVDHRTRSTHRTDLVLVEPALTAGTGGPDPLVELLADQGARRVAVLTGLFEPGRAAACFARGYAGYLSTRLPSHELVDALRAINDGRRVLAPRDASAEGEGSPGRGHGLTRRETDVLVLIASGLSNRDIATELHLSINSVKSYVRSAYNAIGVASRTQAVLWTITQGLTTSAAAASRTASREQLPPEGSRARDDT
ncbi:DNA-binding response regulator, NarL/FixJ family, contains REC and HTH domains [Nocardioides exalbidus]|uniref:DNA-binding response regulator, NarL/FixJ family, contains REC and HTH domains n=1 Tax=Nocardioides exalbidus TaxID=402596 RepID=A0A1H4WPX8_9ACTN|nr:response regulator transcription factor [Nocardioides exalbidus]SEC94661.1 DNA-binding response regulator, NarL/FixJ family, contains REC and HTH domains [Nocardioides exalbidus]